MQNYRIVDLQVEAIESKEIIVQARSPESAAKLALGLDLVRAGGKGNLRAKVYFQHPGQPSSMVRLYTKAADRDA